MRRALAYARTSSGRQKDNTSIPDQLRICRAAAPRLGAAVVAEFADEAVSAKRQEGLTESFEGRPEWARLLAYAAAEREAGRPVDLVLVKDYKRFSRDEAAAHAELHRLAAMGLEFQAVEQYVDPSVPAARMVRSIYIAEGEVDNDYRAAVTRRGMVARLASGVFIHKPPVGYRATHDGGRRTGIEPDPELAPLVVEAFRASAAPGAPIDAGRQLLARRVAELTPGRRPQAVRSRTRWKDTLVNRVYAGEVHVPEQDGHPPRWVEGRHARIVCPELWARVQRKIQAAARPQTRRSFNPGVPLRGLVRAPRSHRDAGSVCSGSGSKSKTGAKVWYYHTLGRGAYRVPAELVHDAARAALAELAPPPEVAALAAELAREMVLGEGASLDAQRERARAELERAEAKLLRAAEARIEGAIDAEAYGALSAKYRAARDQARAELDACGARQAEAPELADTVARAARLVCDLPRLYGMAGPEGRRALVGSILPSGFEVEGGAVFEPRWSAVAALFSAFNGAAGPETKKPAPLGERAVPCGDPDET